MKLGKRILSLAIVGGMALSLLAPAPITEAAETKAADYGSAVEYGSVETATSTDAEAEIESVIETVDNSVVVTEDSTIEAEEVEAEEASESVSYYVHQQTYGNSAVAVNGATAGHINTGKRLEAVSISRNTQNSAISGSIQYRVHCQTYGWTSWVADGKVAGTTGQAKRLEAISIQLTGDLGAKYDVYYRTYMSNSGWLDWTKNGAVSGTTGYGAVLEGIEVLLCKKDSGEGPAVGRYASITSDNLNTVSYSGHVQTYGNVAAVSNGAMLGTVGKAKRLEAIKINMTHGSNQMYGQIKYKVHCQTYGWMNQVVEGNLAGTTGQAKRIEAVQISLTGDIAQYCDIYYRVHARKFGWMGWAKNGESAGTTGNAYRVEAIEIKILPKGSAAPGSTNNAYSSKVYEETTSGYALLEPYINNILAECTNSSMSNYEKLRACYNYVVGHYTYRTLSADHPANFTWEQYYAYQIATTGSGNCYAYASIFAALARKVGYPQAVVIRGSLGSARRPHGWCQIDGILYDPEIQFKHPNLDRFGFTNITNPYNYHY